jgi:hypothetical protein
MKKEKPGIIILGFSFFITYKLLSPTWFTNHSHNHPMDLLAIEFLIIGY